MLYNTCPTCGFFIGNYTYQYEQEKEKICSDPKLTQDEREKALQNLIMSIPLKRYCCRMRMMTYQDYVKDIIAPTDEN
jgi:DNA-directed RNA polymerase subunit N (RpoN/RPB10)